MKSFKGTFVVVGLILASFAANAQSVGIGIKGGLNFAKLDGGASLSANYDNRTGYHFGAYALFKLGKIGIQPELLYSKQGSKYSANLTNFDANFDYINVPILLKLYTVAGINIQLGPQIGFPAGGSATYTYDGTTTNWSSSQFLKGKDISAAMGLGWDLPFGLSVDARYNLGLSNNSNIGGTVKNQVIMVSVGYRLFKIGA